MHLYLLIAVSFISVCVAASSPRTIPIIAPVDGVIGGAAAVNGSNNVKFSHYYVAPDFFEVNFTSKSLKILDHWSTYQQTSDYSCGAASTLMVLYHFGIKDVSEDHLVKEMDVRPPSRPRPDGSYGCTTASIAKALTQRGLSVMTSRDKCDDNGYSFHSETSFISFIESQLSAGYPIIVESVEFGGHWFVIIGYDDSGTPGHIGDDVLILADPYDTTDHLQDGYMIKSSERFFDEWFDRGVMPVNERIQQFVTVVRH